MIYANSKIYKNNQTSIPSKIRKTFNAKTDDIIEWKVDNNNEITLKFRKKVTFDDIKGSINLGYETNSVKLEKEIYE
jgi:bifunctional DNA-binding transcriptional regulator/antitoxin component of YhaV-PrlF toxin-antitoxin module